MKTYIVTVIIFCSSVVLLGGCSSEMDSYTLQKSIFIEDVENPGLPVYSEWGYNTFGTYIDRVPFTSANDVLPVKIVVNSDTLNILLKGTINENLTSLKFSFIGYPLADYPDLKSLNDSVLDMKGNKCIVVLTRYGVPEKLKIIEGKLHIKRVQDLYVDREYTKSIISGTFNFKTFFSGEPVAISNGRFDFGIGYDNFYNF